LSVRDNVLFELGIFIGALGIEKCFIVAPESKRSLFRLPTDLAGVTLSYYNDLNEDSVDSVATSCAKIKAEIRKQMSAQPSQLVDASPTQVLLQQLSTTQSQLWMMGHEVERAKAETSRMAESIKNYFFSTALSAT
ncbi:TIR domain-containing protein, partial [Pseudomonas viridiflava]|uniref:TIR domain-containing protein n=1 Tax=Pseudomonas viridiflava TaxID=33069 RepID=UPI0013CEB6AA